MQSASSLGPRVPGFRPGWTAIAAMLALLLSWGTLVAATDPFPVRMYNTNGSADEKKWTVITGKPSGLNPRNVVLTNGRVRVAYPPTQTTEKAGHLLYVYAQGKWQLAGDIEFGDWTYAGSSFTDPVTNFTILENTAKVARIQSSFDFHRHEYQNNTPFPVRKTIVLHSGAWGYRALIQLPSDLPGEREVGFGGTSSHLFCYTSKKGILWNPYQPPSPTETDGTDYEWIRDEGQQANDWWAASLAFDRSYYRMVSLRFANKAGLRTGQFSGGHTGHLIHWAYQGFASYEAFVAAVPYDGSMAARVTVSNKVATVHVPKPGIYSLYTRQTSGRRHTYVPAKANIKLKGGYNNVYVGDLQMYAPIIVPVSDGATLPEDVSKEYRYGRRD